MLFAELFEVENCDFFNLSPNEIFLKSKWSEKCADSNESKKILKKIIFSS